MLAVTAVIGYGVYRLIHIGVEDRVTKAIREGQNFTKASTEIYFGLWYFEQYEAETKRKKEMAEIWEKLTRIQSALQSEERSGRQHNSLNDDPLSYLQAAIKSTTRAIGTIKELDKKKYDELICVCKNNVAYYLAERQKQGKAEKGDNELAKSYVRYIRKRIGEYPQRKAEWAGTCKFVEQYFPSNDQTC